MTQDVLITTDGAVGRISLNRPKQIHALTHAMCEAIGEALIAWRADPAIELVLIDHAEGRGFCAGGDIRALWESGRADGAAARAFFHAEYRLNHLMFTYSKPIVAFMDGIVMGGGVGISQPAWFRIATERTRYAMPETGIGLFPDVGGGWYLSRMAGRMGQYLGVTGAQIDGGAARALGLATHYLPSEGLEALKAELVARPRSAQALLDSGAAPAPRPSILDQRDAIERLFASDKLEDIVSALEAQNSDFARETLATMATKSPQTMKVTLRLLAQARDHVDFAEEMRIEYAVAAHVVQRNDFIEGVRALIVDKDGAPRWDPPTIEAVSDHLIDTIFAPLPADEAWTPYRV